MKLLPLANEWGATVSVHPDRITKVVYDHFHNGRPIYAYHIAGLKKPVLATDRPEDITLPDAEGADT